MPELTGAATPTAQRRDEFDHGHVDSKYLDAATRVGTEYKQRSHNALRVSTGNQVLDVGCGTGDNARVIAKIVGSSGRIVGVDNREEMVTEARHRSAHIAPSTEFVVADGLALPFENDSFDAARTDRTLLHVRDREAVIAEMARVVRPGGILAIVGRDCQSWPSKSSRLRVVGSGHAPFEFGALSRRS